MKYEFALRAQNSGQPMIRVVDAYMRRDPTFLAFAEGNPALEACPNEAIAEIAEKLIRDARLLDEAGCFAIVLEKIPSALAEKVTAAVSCPTIGIGAGAVTDGQVLVLHDMLGLNQGFKPKFLRQFAQLGEAVNSAVSDYIDAVKTSSFPNESESY